MQAPEERVWTTDPQQLIDFAQGLVLQRFAEARTSIDAFKAELFEKLDGLEARLVRIEQRMSTFEGRQPRFEADLPEIGRMVRERL